MNIQFDEKAHVKSIRRLVNMNQSRWMEMDREHKLHHNAASYTWLRRFGGGEFKNPGILTLGGVQRYLS